VKRQAKALINLFVILDTMSKVSPKKLIQKNPFILAPMDEVTDIAFRELCEEEGAAYSSTELTSVDALIRDKVQFSRYQRGNLKVNSVQLFGSKPEVFTQALEKVESEADIIDVNFGCPSTRVAGNNCGSMLLKDPKNVGEIIAKLVKKTKLPVTAKIRLGYKKMTYLGVAKEVEDAGAELLAVHGRTADQKYSGSANWQAIEEIYNAVHLPLVGNGDITSEADIDSHLHKHADALMIGRAAIGNPLLFKKFNYYHKNKEKLDFENEKDIRKELFIRYLKKLNNYDFYKENLKIQKQAMYFMKGIPGAKELRKEIMQLKDSKTIIKKVEEF
jgi:nifR3 family TIM-barrel protein